MKIILISTFVAVLMFTVFTHVSLAQSTDITLPVSPPILIVPSSGDINGDKSVNLLDYTLLSKAYGTNDAASDLNHDKLVDLLDFTILSGNFGMSI
jgi:hypothetical protein